MALSADLLVGLGTALIVALLVAILAAVDPSIRRKVSVIRKNGHIESVWVNKRNLVSHGGAWWYVVDGQRYAALGPSYTFAYRLVRSFGLKKHVGTQRIYLEGNPTPFVFKHEDRAAVLDDTARLLGTAVDTDLPDRLMNPPRTNWVVLILAASLALVIGVIVGRSS